EGRAGGEGGGGRGRDPTARERERIERPPVAGRIGRIDLIGPYAQAGLVEIDFVQFPAELDQGAIAADSDVRNDRAHDRLDVGRCLALGGKKGAKTLGEIGGAAVETDRHGPVLPAGRVSGPWRGRGGAANPGGGAPRGIGWTDRRPARPPPSGQRRLPGLAPPTAPP